MKLIAFAMIFVCVFGGYILAGGKMGIIIKATPVELLIIMGASLCAFVISNTGHVIKDCIKYLSCLIKPETYNKKSYQELLSVLFQIFKLARTKGWLALEAHIENPDDSALFTEFPEFSKNHHAVTFLCDYLRIISLGNDNPHEIEALMDAEIETIEHEKMHPSHAVQTMADGIPALGIVAAVLGIIKTMASITEPPEVLGKMIGSALVGTFLGVFLSYAFVGPISMAMGAKGESEVQYYKAIRIALIAFLNGSAPQVAVDFARKYLPHHLQPSFLELEEILNELPAPT